MTPQPTIESGAVVVLRLYDIAYAIDLARAEALAAAAEPVSRAKLTKTEPKAMSFSSPPVQVALGTIELAVGEVTRAAEASARVYDFGAVSLALRFAVSDVGWDEYVALTTEIDRAAAAPAAAAAWSGLLERVRRAIGPALQRPSHSPVEEDYLLSIVNRWDRALDAEDVLRDLDIARLLSGEARPLSEPSRQELLRHRFSYYRNDLVVLTWDHAFLVEPTGETDVVDVLEVANAQLLELLYFDALLDAELPRMYERVERARTAIRRLTRRRYADLAREYYRLVAEVTEVTEKAENAVKVVEDVYLARVYSAALELFRVPAWSAAVDRKLEIVRDTYSALYDEGTASRAELLELTIVLLIVFEIVMAFLM